ncbi:sulfotransferase family protein [Alloyangia pacifica]|uniref:sulfotransferase family protein n=1 Tax=Alloyangia pacifica TaxID=311180 RepID=UPI001CD674A7|nr:sulfotransferase family protein [Alloyangia pacifica]MCA0996579.1 sulfotransferase family protein [Alloyangia pacifica]
MTQKTFFLGLGGQKCGSTWIQAYLNRQEGSDFGRLGEYQVWEHELGGVFARYRVATPPLKERVRARLKTGLGAEEPAQHLRWRLQSDPEAYFDYFAGLLDRPGIVRTGDITPSYAALPPEMLARIRDGFAKRGIATAVIFSMRDPVARLRSHLRMEMAKGRLPQSESNTEALRAFYPGAEAEARSRYDRTLAALEAAFPQEQRFICLFENLFQPEGIAALSAFAGVPSDPSQGAQAVNSRASGSDVPDALAAEIAAHYAAVYAAVIERLPEARSLWPSARFVLTSA